MSSLCLSPALGCLGQRPRVLILSSAIPHSQAPRSSGRPLQGPDLPRSPHQPRGVKPRSAPLQPSHFQHEARGHFWEVRNPRREPSQASRCDGIPITRYLPFSLCLRLLTASFILQNALDQGFFGAGGAGLCSLFLPERSMLHFSTRTRRITLCVFACERMNWGYGWLLGKGAKRLQSVATSNQEAESDCVRFALRVVSQYRMVGRHLGAYIPVWPFTGQDFDIMRLVRWFLPLWDHFHVEVSLTLSWKRVSYLERHLTIPRPYF